MLSFLENSLKRTDANVVRLWHTNQIKQVKAKLTDQGFGKAVRSDLITFLPEDSLMEPMILDGNVRAASRIAQEKFDTWLGEGYSEIRFGGSAAGSMFSMGHYGLTKEWEAYLHETAHKIVQTVYCPYPQPSSHVTFDALKNVASVHNWIVFSGKAYRTDLASFRGS